MPKCPKCRQENVEGTSLCRQCGAKLPVASPAKQAAAASPEAAHETILDDGDIVELVRKGQRIGAVKLYRQRHGVGLAEAKNAVEALAAGRATVGTGVPADVQEQLLDLMRAGHKIQAVKLYREHHHVGLKEAKDAIEALAAQHGIAPQGSGCAGAILLGIAGLAAGAWGLLA